jgi:hypothetical protein
MQFLWFLAHEDGSVTMKYRGEPDEWDEALKANVIMAVRDLVEGMTGEDIADIEIVEMDEDLPDVVDRIIPFKPRSVQ